MSIAAAQSSVFYEQVAREGRVFTVLDADEFLVFRIGDHEVVPFWSSRSRIETVQKRSPKYLAWKIEELPLAGFLEKTLALLQEENVRVGVNWAGDRLVGYDVPVAELRKTLEYWQKKVRDEG